MAEEKKKYVALMPLQIGANKKPLKVGAQIELDDDEAESLTAAGAVTLYVPAKKAKEQA